MNLFAIKPVTRIIQESETGGENSLRRSLGGGALIAIGSGCAGFCYSEFSSMIPIAGSAYTYAYATLGELLAWIIGWDLVLEYTLACACVASGWSAYLNEFLAVATQGQL